MTNDTFRIGFLAWVLVLAPATLSADELRLTDGARLVGTIELLTDSVAHMSETFAGNLTVPRDKIVSMSTEGPVTVQKSDGAYLTGRLSPMDDGSVAIEIEGIGSRSVPLEDIKGVYLDDPQTLLRKQLATQFTADANVGIMLTSGNTDTDNMHLDGRLIARTLQNRYTLSGEYNAEKSEGVKIKEDWRSLVKYDHFVSKKWFWFTSATFENNDFKDLNLRSAIASGIGYQFFESNVRRLSLELGASYIDENYIVADDDSFLGARWALNYDQKLWDGFSFFHYHEGLIGLEDTRELTIRSRTGLQMDVREQIIARIQTSIDWDNSPPVGSKSTDVEHSLTIGYRF